MGARIEYEGSFVLVIRIFTALMPQRKKPIILARKSATPGSLGSAW